MPEWIPWVMRALQNKGLDRSIYLWSDDNLSNDYFWKFLTDQDRELIDNYPNYGRVCCFKGFNQESFSFNTRAYPELFDRQFALMRQLLTTNMDMYAYVTLTSPNKANIADDVALFVDRLQELDHNLPLRTVPLNIQAYSPVLARMSSVHHAAIQNQYSAAEAWRYEIENRFTCAERNANVADIPVGKRHRQLHQG